MQQCEITYIPVSTFPAEYQFIHDGSALPSTVTAEQYEFVESETQGGETGTGARPTLGSRTIKGYPATTNELAELGL